MSLSITNVDAERGFSVNKRVLDGRESLGEGTLISYRLIKDVIRHHDKDCLKIKITNEMLSYADRAHKAYIEDLRDKKDLESKEKELKEKEKSLENEKIKNDRKKEKEEIKLKIKAIQLNIEASENLIKEGNVKITMGLNTKCDVYVVDGQRMMSSGIRSRLDLAKKLTDLEYKLNMVNA